MRNSICKNYIIISIFLLGVFTVSPCYASSPNGSESVSGIVTAAFFDGIAGKASASCEAKGFYTRAAFLEAAESYPKFGTVGSADVAKREVAAFFAHVTHETIQMCYINEINGTTRDYCDETDTEYPCASGKMYYGRGPIQLSWNFNYGPAGKSIGFDGLNNPDVVAKDSVISFKTALWFWMKYCHSLIVSGKGFGATIRAINGIECDGGGPRSVRNRVKYFKEYCRQFGIQTGDRLTC
ncbi:PREDICTED: chitinase 6-like [Ipomoea nil]|uniref:chitinase 6-like n=1 Tax=Ipomoea nil TaxID=35883 RepID=UPI0009018F39|nr:PREDICTED: chitinase 6-like [Ipomoea nil]